MNLLNSKSECKSQQDYYNPYEVYKIKEEEKVKEPIIDVPMFFLALIPIYTPFIIVIICWIVKIFMPV